MLFLESLFHRDEIVQPDREAEEELLDLCLTAATSAPHHEESVGPRLRRDTRGCAVHEIDLNRDLFFDFFGHSYLSR